MIPLYLSQKKHPMDDVEFTEEMEDELIELFPFIPDILERAKKDTYILELLEERDIDTLSHYLEN